MLNIHEGTLHLKKLVFFNIFFQLFTPSKNFINCHRQITFPFLILHRLLKITGLQFRVEEFANNLTKDILPLKYHWIQEIRFGEIIEKQQNFYPSTHRTCVIPLDPPKKEQKILSMKRAFQQSQQNFKNSCQNSYRIIREKYIYTYSSCSKVAILQ